MKLKDGVPNKLHDRTERVVAKLALKAYSNALFGGASALVIARRLDRIGNNLPYPATSIVTDVWHDRGNQYFPYECFECGETVLGEENALNHCYIDEREGNYND